MKPHYVLEERGFEGGWEPKSFRGWDVYRDVYGEDIFLAKTPKPPIPIQEDAAEHRASHDPD